MRYSFPFFWLLNFLLSLTYKQRKYCFSVKFSKWRFWWIYTFWGPLNPKITFLVFGLCLCLIGIIQKHISAEISNLVFYICIMYRCYLKFFIKIGQKLCVQGHTKNSNTLRPMDEISCYWIFLYLECGKHKEIHIYVCHGRKHVNYRIWNELHAWLI